MDHQCKTRRWWLCLLLFVFVVVVVVVVVVGDVVDVFGVCFCRFF